MVSPFDLCLTLPVGGGLSVPCSLPGCRWLLWCLAGWAISVSVLPLTYGQCFWKAGLLHVSL